jgi:hypothetical protein
MSKASRSRRSEICSHGRYISSAIRFERKAELDSKAFVVSQGNFLCAIVPKGVADRLQRRWVKLIIPQSSRQRSS